MALHHVAQGTRLIVELPSPFNTQLLGYGELGPHAGVAKGAGTQPLRVEYHRVGDLTS